MRPAFRAPSRKKGEALSPKLGRIAPRDREDVLFACANGVGAKRFVKRANGASAKRAGCLTIQSEAKPDASSRNDRARR
jgi:hypothetical protein